MGPTTPNKEEKFEEPRRPSCKAFAFITPRVDSADITLGLSAYFLLTLSLSGHSSSMV
jgi:hypothetical protein